MYAKRDRWGKRTSASMSQSASEHKNCLRFYSCIKSIFNPLILLEPMCATSIHYFSINILMCVDCVSRLLFMLDPINGLASHFEYSLYCAQRNSILRCAKMREAIPIFTVNVTTLYMFDMPVSASRVAFVEWQTPYKNNNNTSPHFQWQQYCIKWQNTIYEQCEIIILQNVKPYTNTCTARCSKRCSACVIDVSGMEHAKQV